MARMPMPPYVSADRSYLQLKDVVHTVELLLVSATESAFHMPHDQLRREVSRQRLKGVSVCPSHRLPRVELIVRLLGLSRRGPGTPTSRKWRSGDGVLETATGAAAEER